MAAGWLRHLSGDAADGFSGGSAPAGDVNHVAVEAMAEVGIDIRTEFPSRGPTRSPVSSIAQRVRRLMEGLDVPANV